MDDQMARKRAQELIKEAEAEQSTFFLWRSNDNFKNAAAKYKDAGVQLKIAKDFEAATDLQLKAAEIYLNKGNDRMNAALCYNEAGLCARQFDHQKSVEYYKKAADLYLALGRPSQAAKIFDEVAVIYDQDLLDRPNAIKCHQAAGDCYKNAKSEATAHGCFIKAANLMISDGQYLEAIKQFEIIAEHYARMSTMPHQVNNACYRSLLSQFAYEVQVEKRGNAIKTLERLERYTSIYPTFEDNDEARMIKELIAAYGDNNLEAFQTSLKKRQYKLDEPAVNILVIIKRAMEGDLVQPTRANTGDASPQADNVDDQRQRPVVAKADQFVEKPHLNAENQAEDLL